MSEALTIARPYAQAAFEYAQEHHALEAWDAALQGLVVLAAHPDMVFICHSHKVDPETVTSIIAELLDIKVGTPLHNFVAILAQARRVVVAKQIYQVFKALENEANQVEDVQITTAIALDAAQRDDFKNKLEQKFKKKVNMTCHVDTSVLGGAIVRFGDKVIDLCLRSQIRKLAHSLIV
jgi:F-type H+-transporting ATPase subunit delta